MSEHVRTRLVQFGALAMSALLAFALIEAQPAEAAGITVAASKAATGKVTVVKGKKYKLGVKATAGAKVTYKSSKTKVATVTKKGTIKAKRAGKATITITAKIGKSKAVKKVRVTVVTKSKYKKVKGIKVYSKSRSIKVGGTTKITPVFKPEKPSNKNLVFKSSNPSVAKVSPKGTVKGLTAGKATITVKSADNKRAIAKVKVTVEAKKWVIDQEAYDEKIPICENHPFMVMKGGHQVFVMDDDIDTLYLEVKKVTTDSCASIAPHQYLNNFYTTEGVETLKLPDAFGRHSCKAYSFDESKYWYCPWLLLIEAAVGTDYDVDFICAMYGTANPDLPYDSLSPEDKAKYRNQLKHIVAKLKDIDDECEAIEHNGVLCKANYAASEDIPKYFLTGFKTVRHKEVGHWE